MSYGLNYWRLHRDAYRENDAGTLAQAFGKLNVNGLDNHVGARLRYGISTESYHLGIAGGLKFAYALKGYNIKDTIYTVGGPTSGFAISIPNLGRSTFSPSLTLSGKHKEAGPKIALSYIANIRAKRKSHELYLEARWNF